MKRAILVFLAAILAGCGGGGTSSYDGGGQQQTTTVHTVPTPSGTPVSMAAMKAVFYGMSSGRSYSFSLTGADTAGHRWSGSFATAAKGTTTLAGSNGGSVDVSWSQALLTVQQEGMPSTTTLSKRYFRLSDQALYRFSNGTTMYGALTASPPLPGTVKVGDFGQLADLSASPLFYSDPLQTVWSLAPGVNGGSYLTFTTDSHSAAGIDTETDTFALDPSGNPTALTIRYVNRYLGNVLQDITLQGPRL